MQDFNHILYETKVAQEFQAEYSLDVDCTRAYYTETEELADRMVTKINNAMASDSEMSSCHGNVASVIAKQQNFIAIGSEVCSFIDI